MKEFLEINCCSSERFTACRETSEIAQCIWNFSGLSGRFPTKPKAFRLLGKLSRLSGNLQGFSGSFQFIWKLSSLSWGFLANLIRFVWKVESSPGKFTDEVEYFQLICQLSGLSRNFTDCMETFKFNCKFSEHLEDFQIILRISGLSGKFPKG